MSFWFIFGLHLGRFFHIFSTSFSLLVYCGLTCNVCPIVLASFLGAPSPIRILLEDSYGFRTCIFLRNLLFPSESLSKNSEAWLLFRIVFSCILIVFPASVLAMFFPSKFDGKWHKKRYHLGCPKSDFRYTFSLLCAGESRGAPTAAQNLHMRAPTTAQACQKRSKSLETDASASQNRPAIVIFQHMFKVVCISSQKYSSTSKNR